MYPGLLAGRLAKRARKPPEPAPDVWPVGYQYAATIRLRLTWRAETRFTAVAPDLLAVSVDAEIRLSLTWSAETSFMSPVIKARQRDEDLMLVGL